MFAKKDKAPIDPKPSEEIPSDEIPTSDSIESIEEVKEPKAPEEVKPSKEKVKVTYPKTLDEKKEYIISFKGKEKKVSGNVANVLIGKGIAKLIK